MDQPTNPDDQPAGETPPPVAAEPPTVGTQSEAGKIACPQCGQMNVPSAEFCWSCFQVMGAGAAAGPGAMTPEASRRLLLESDTVPVGPREGELNVSVDLPFHTRRRNRVTFSRVLGLLLLIAAAVFGAQRGLERWNGDVSGSPTSIGGFKSLSDPATLQFQSSFLASVSAGGLGSSETRFYGAETGAPQIQLIWIKDPHSAAATFLTQAPFSARDPDIQAVKIADKTFYCTQALPTRQAWIPKDSSGGVCAWLSGGFEWILVSRVADTDTQVLANGASVGRGVSTFVFVGMFGALAVIAGLLALRIVWRMAFG